GALQGEGRGGLQWPVLLPAPAGLGEHPPQPDQGPVRGDLEREVRVGRVVGRVGRGGALGGRGPGRGGPPGAGARGGGRGRGGGGRRRGVGRRRAGGVRGDRRGRRDVEGHGDLQGPQRQVRLLLEPSPHLFLQGRPRGRCLPTVVALHGGCPW